ncbi:ABC transporter ATP-binding protein [Luteipulveratus mongoliensis]|uniref:ABC transporter domain-containing protein n=1 Tax=Luteipulveratus mongoliensis TaxID=571913 RepID=A0A0K1JPF8_9MICO|nr:ATP-binding cassette domain-containing protein [Luteipulveratus mongoliensis]AKU18450.1 hypothetical protein VV02_25665 [Luteipulveratus mongoliensis]
MTATLEGLSVSVARLVHIYRADGHDVAALSGVDLSVSAGGTLALLGPSGAGKSTLLSLIAGMERPTAGTITIGDQRTDQLDDAEIDTWRGDRVALVLQGGHRNLLPYLTVRDNIRLAQWGSTNATPDAEDLISWVGLQDDVADCRPAQLTESQAQLAALCVGAAAAPGLLLADEPTASLSTDATEQVISALQRVNDALGTTILTVTHDPTLASAMQRTVTIRDGRVGAHAQDGVELAVVSPDGSVPLPDDVLDELPPGTLLRVQRDPDQEHLRLVVEPWDGQEGRGA